VPPRRPVGSKSLIALGFAVAVCLGFSVPARAQIYSWHDGNGNLVLSNQPHPGATVRTFAVPASEHVRTTRSAVSDRGRPFDDLIAQNARERHVRVDLVRAVMQVESAFNPRARSPKGALGLMQLMPATIQQFGVRDAFDPGENVRAGVAYLRQLLDRYGNDETLALAAYNAGPGAVDKHGNTVPPYRETRNYVAQINDMAGRSTHAAGTKIYRTTEVIDGREVVRYSDRPSSPNP